MLQRAQLATLLVALLLALGPLAGALRAQDAPTQPTPLASAAPTAPDVEAPADADAQATQVAIGQTHVPSMDDTGQGGGALGDAAMSAELASFLSEGGEEATTVGTDTLSFYGFSDFTYGKVWGDDLATSLRPYSSFYVGNLNLYADARLADEWRALTEVRFTYMPHGSFDKSGELVTVQAQDYADNNATTNIGGIEIERAWVEYAPYTWLTLKAGQWLTPYGIWNVDHGTPTLIAIQKPYLVSSSVLPERQTGLVIAGSVPVSESTDLYYKVTVSNGRGGTDAYRDLDGNKALGGRLELRHTGAARVQLGVSGYTGRYTESELQISLVSDLPDIAFVPQVRYDEAAIAADLRVTWQGWDLVAEAVVGEVVYVKGSRPNGLRGLSPHKQADLLRGGAYAIAGYTIDALLLTPFVGYDYIADPLAVGTAHFFRAGMRFTPVAPVTAKVEFFHLIPGGKPLAVKEFDSLRFQLAWAFR